MRRELRALLPPKGPVLVLGVGNRRITADALGPRTAQKRFSHHGAAAHAAGKRHPAGGRHCAGVSASTGLTLAASWPGRMVEQLRPAALICVDSLCSAEGARLGRTRAVLRRRAVPGAGGSRKASGRGTLLGVPVIAAGIPTLMDSDEGADLVVTPRALDSVIAHGLALLAQPSTGPCSPG